MTATDLACTVALNAALVLILCIVEGLTLLAILVSLRDSPMPPGVIVCLAVACCAVQTLIAGAIIIRANRAQSGGAS